jgi:hypothetical protein
MPLFFLIAIGMGALTIGATATDAKRWLGTDRSSASAEVTAFYASSFRSSADCLNAAYLVHVSADACGVNNGEQQE